MSGLRALGAVVAATGLALVGFGAAGRQGGQDRQERESLSASTEVGRVLDREGVAARRGVLADRWGPIEEGAALTPGDWLEVGSRGANALKARMTGGAELILGPGTLVEVASAGRVELVRGELLVDATRVPEEGGIEVRGPGATTVHVDERAVLRSREGALEELDEAPRWLVGYEANASTEAMGSLLANVDGRNVPLTIGYHKVTVDIRDQIARTVIEESFENHTSTVLEGVFYFPLPADASISGFGMWIGGKLVQGDIVEKQRAREIYETILRERRDPGLLEWTGGNVFKARVYPIGAEKRIRIAYTQVLPKVGDTFAYHYALQSELLRKTPLRRLEIEVNVSSAEPLAAVECPSHACRIRAGEHSAKVELAAEELAPERDFELRVQLAPRAERLSLIPHRRGDDGYFMLLVDAPPAPPVDEREAEPIELLVLADTSGSMWGPARANQVAFVEALVSALGPADTFALATVDVETRWAFDRPLPGDLEHRERALRFLEDRDPLGWTDLARAFASACERANDHTHVVYVGDGVPTAASADPVELAHELGRLYRGKGTFHAVVPGPSSEMSVLRALAGLGGGSVRSIEGGTDPTQTAFALLHELGAPAVKNLEVTFEGLAVGAVYPETLPNLPAGGQAIVVGRFDPRTLGTGKGRVRVTGTLDGEPVCFEREVTLAADTEEAEGSSFIPRLWARYHLDHLLDQGASDLVTQRIIALSEDYQIVTPHTSFLVLESDADRERFGVQKRFRMRDGEEFFTAGRESATHELRRQQMLVARGWRRELRERAIAALQGMGRDLNELLRGADARIDRIVALGYSELEDRNAWNEPMSENGGFYLGAGQRAASREDLRTRDLFAGEPPDDSELDGDDRLGEVDLKEAFQDERPLAARERLAMKSSSRAGLLPREEAYRGYSPYGLIGGPSGPVGGPYGRGGGGPGYYGDPFAALFPTVGPPRASDPETTWSDDVLALLARLDRREVLARSTSGWRFTTQTTWTDARGREQTTHGLHLVGPDRWVTSGAHVAGNAYRVDWLEDGRRGVLMEGWRLGRVRAAEAGDERSWPTPFALHFGDQLRSYAAYDAELVERDGTRARVRFRPPGDEKNAFTLDLDVERGLVLEAVWTFEGERRSGQTFEEFREVGGAWWPTRIRSWTAPAGSASAPRDTVTEIAVDAFGAGELARLVEAELTRRDDAILLPSKQGRVSGAKQAVRDGKAGLEERWLLLSYYARTQRWEAAAPHLDALLEAAAGRPGLAPIRLTWLQQRRRDEELRIELLRVASTLAETPRDAEYGLATDLLRYAGALNPGNEVQDVLRAIRPVFQRQPAIPEAELAWDQRWLQALANLGRPESSFEARREAAVRWPYSVEMQTAYAELLAQRGEVDPALELLRTAEAENGPWQPYERSQLRQSTARILAGAYRLEEWVDTFEAWEREDPAQLDQNLDNQYLSALVFLDREREAAGKIDAWLAPANESQREPYEQARLYAAVQHALGQGYQLYHQRFDDAGAERLANTARALVRHDADASMAGWILQHWLFKDTDAGRALLGELYREVEMGLDELSPQRLQAQIGWLRGASYATDAGEEAWQALFERVFQRWLATADERERAPLAQIVQAWGAHELRARFFRQLLARATDGRERIAAATQLCQELRRGPWSAEVEGELVSLLGALALDAEEGERDEALVERNLDLRLLALHDLVDWILSARTDAIVAALPGYDGMSRRTLRASRDEALRTVRASAAKLMAGLEQTLEPKALRDQATLERTFLEVANRADLDAAWSRSLALLNAGIASLAGAEEPEDVPLRERILAERCIATCALLLLHTDEAALEEREGALHAALERLVASECEFPDGRVAIRTLLLVLDEADELEAALSAWYAEGREYGKLRWGRDYAHLLAERGEIEAAAEVLEAIDRIDELGPEDFRALADWYTALDQPERAREARIRSYEVQGENRLANDLWYRAQDYQRQGEDVPPELDPEIPLRLVALMRKAREPQNRFWLLRSFYAATKDFRLLECLPAAVIGHSAQSIYPFLGEVAGLAELVDEEATVDRVQARLAELRAGGGTDVDRRALALLQFQIESRAARQAHGTERHAERSLRALAEAFQGQWEEGEIGWMAEFLAGQGRLQPDALAAEQVRQLRALSQAATDPDERLIAAHALARTLWSYEEQDEAVRVLEGALAERRRVTGRLPQAANEPLLSLSSWLVAMKSFREAEATWLGELAAGHSVDQVLWLREQLFGVYRDAVIARGDLSLGSGDALYTGAVAAMERELATRTNEQHAQQVVTVLCDTWRRARRELKLVRAGADAGDFAFGALPAVLRLYQYRGGQPIVATVAECLAEVRGSLTAIEFFVVRAENEPSWLRLQSQDFWQRHAWRFGDLLVQVVARHELQGALEERALAVVLAELREDLSTRRSGNRSVYDARYGHFWTDKRPDFVRATLAFLEGGTRSPRAVAYAAEYLFRGLSAHEEAITALFVPYRRGTLHVAGRDELATYLQERGRWAESIPVVTGLVAERPAEARYRAMLMRGDFHTGALAARTSAFEAAETWFRANGAWAEDAIVTLAEGCLDTELFEDCTRLYDDAIALRVRTAPGRGVGDGVLCRYYRKQSGAYSGLGRTDEAVDAAAGAVVSWGRHVDQRQEELQNLEQVLDQAVDLADYVSRLDAEVRATGLENPIVRKALGQVWLAREDWVRAAAQLELALAAQPNDSETHALLMKAHEGMERPDLAAASLLERARTEGHELDLWVELGSRLLELDRVGRSERAFTNLVELSPNESEGHRLLAEVRERQDRWEEAAERWRHVVRLRTGEPTGYLGLARALVHLERAAEARDVLDHLRTTSWPARFGDVRGDADALLR